MVQKKNLKKKVGFKNRPHIFIRSSMKNTVFKITLLYFLGNGSVIGINIGIRNLLPAGTLSEHLPSHRCCEQYPWPTPHKYP